MLPGVPRKSQLEADHAHECGKSGHKARVVSACALRGLLREALSEHFQLPLEVLKVLCAKVCYLDVPWSKKLQDVVCMR